MQNGHCYEVVSERHRKPQETKQEAICQLSEKILTGPNSPEGSRGELAW